MKKGIILIISIIPLLLSAYAHMDINGIDLYADSSDLPYDYAAVLIDRGYINDPQMHSQIIKLFETSLQGSYNSFSARVFPDYLSMEFYMERGDASAFISSLRRFLNGKAKMNQGDYSGYDIFDIALMERFGLEPETSPADYAVNVSSLYSKMSLFIESSLNIDEIFRYAAQLSGPEGKTISIRKNSAYGQFGEKLLADTIKMYDIPGIKDFDYPYYYLLLYYLNTARPAADIRWTGESGSLIITGNLPDKPDEAAFKRALDDLKEDISVAEGSMSAFVSIYGRTALYKNAKIIKGLENKALSIRFGRFADFISGLEYDYSLVPQPHDTYIQQSRAMELSNGITLIYTYSKEPKTDMSILIGDIRKYEEYYSKPFSSEVILDEFGGYLRNWRQANASLFSDIRAYSTYCSAGRIEERLNEFFGIVQSWDIRHYRKYSYYDSIFQKGLSDEAAATMLNKTKETWRSRYSDGYKMLTDGEYRLLFKSLFSNRNILVSVRTDRSAEEIEKILLKMNAYQMTADIQKQQSILEGCVDFRNMAEASHFSALFLAAPGEYLIDGGSVCRISGYRRGEEAAAFSSLTKNLAVNGGMSLLTALSYHLTGNPDYLINSAVNFR